MNKGQIRTRVLQLADAEDSTRWDDAAGGEVDSHIGVIQDREWKRILNVNPYIRLARRQPTTTSTGYISGTDLDSGSGDSTQRKYRVIAVVINNAVYEEMQFREWVTGSKGSNIGPTGVWYWEGDDIFSLPKQASFALTTGGDGVWVSHLPCRQENLATESSTFTFPDGYEDVVAFEAAALLLLKGGAETQAAVDLQRQAELLRQDMLQDFARRSLKAQKFQYADLSFDWGGQ